MTPGPSQVSVDPISCTAHGLCADWLPERVTLDEWGYPLIDREPLDPDLVKHARRAVRECPVQALRLTRGQTKRSLTS